MFDRLISASEVARRGGWHNVTIYQWVKKGKIPGLVRFGRQIRFREADINCWLRGETPVQALDSSRPLHQEETASHAC
jgi:excisionase family DNA binding protein